MVRTRYVARFTASVVVPWFLLDSFSCFPSFLLFVPFLPSVDLLPIVASLGLLLSSYSCTFRPTVNGSFLLSIQFSSLQVVFTSDPGHGTRCSQVTSRGLVGVMGITRDDKSQLCNFNE